MTSTFGTDVYDGATRSRVMRRVRGRDTAPERAVRKILRRMGRGYRLHDPDLPGRPDIVLRGQRIALFVHGCFWHGHDCRRGSRVPKANADYWTGKIAGNRARDRRSEALLAARGWRSLVVWECELRDAEALEARLRADIPAPGAAPRQRPVDPNPPAPRAVSSRASTSTRSPRVTGARTS